MELSNWLALGAFVISVLTGFIALSKRKSEVNLNEANEAEKISAAWERLNGPNEARIADLESRLTKALGRIAELEAENAELRAQLNRRNPRGLLK